MMKEISTYSGLKWQFPNMKMFIHKICFSINYFYIFGYHIYILYFECCFKSRDKYMMMISPIILIQNIALRTLSYPNIFPSLLASFSTLFLHDILGLPRFCCPWGFRDKYMQNLNIYLCNN